MSVHVAERTRLDAVERVEELSTVSRYQGQRFDRLVHLTQRIFDVPMVAINVVGDDVQVTKAGVGIETGTITRRADSFCAHAIEQDGALQVPDARLDPRFADNPLVQGDPHIRFYTGQPLSTKDGDRIGALCLVEDQPRVLEDDGVSLLRELAD